MKQIYQPDTGADELGGSNKVVWNIIASLEDNWHISDCFFRYGQGEEVSDDPCEETYKGPYAYSELETKALRFYFSWKAFLLC